MKKLITLLMIGLTAFSVNAKCDFSKVKLQQWNQGTYYKWYLSGWDKDTCKGYMFTVYDFQLKKTDTVFDNKGVVEIGFGAPGKYKLLVKLWDKCNKCDTLMYRYVDIIAWKPTAGLKSIKKTCDSAWFEMNSFNIKDTCWGYSYYVYQGPELDKLSDKDFLSKSDYDLYNYYSFPDDDLKLVLNSRILKYKFPKNGKYFIIAYYYNKCLGQDTVFFNRQIINCNTTSVNVFIKPEPKLIGIYDMMGRRVYNVRENEIMVYIYSDGTRKKVVKQ
jgi:hypothetical protein